MPQLDVSFMTADPMLADTFTVTRRQDVVNSKGRTTPTVTAVFEDVMGVVTQEDPADLIRLPDGQTVPRKIMVCTSFAARGASTGYQPDVITWDGSDYMVTKVLPYSRFGAGTFEVIAQSTAATDAAAETPEEDGF
jgi:hypothetical protein